MQAKTAALGGPFLVGEELLLQGWYRDSGAPKGTNLSDALKVTLWQ